MSECQLLKTEYQELEKLQQKFEFELEKSIKSGNLEKTKELRKEIEEKLQALKEKITPKKITAKFINPETTNETNKDKDIEIDLEKEIQWQKKFYKEHKIPEFNEQEVKQILRLHKLEIQKEMALYGYDQILIIPKKLPTSEELNEKMTDGDGYVTTWQSNNFKNGGGFTGAKTSESKKTKIILTHSDQNILKDENTNPYLKQTLGKNIMQLSGLSEEQIQERVENNQPIPINFELSGNQIKTEGLSLNEYLILQRQYFQKTNNHLDEKSWTWLPKSCSASRVVDADWDPVARQLCVDAHALGLSDVFLGCRLSRSFELT
ncbi:MAG: hypothetical protein Q7U36_02395 [bacterium]|nr:hypothetical protein [bacterium]